MMNLSVSALPPGSPTLVLLSLALILVAAHDLGAEPWKRPTLTEPNRVEMGGAWGEAYERGLRRIAQDPYSVPFILADVDFNRERWFTNFSGDISGRFLELASLTSSPGSPRPEALRGVLDQITRHQKPDGHFGMEVDWQGPIDLIPDVNKARMMPILWGNGRLLLGLVAAHERFGDRRLLDSARKLGDFYRNVVIRRFCDPERAAEYRKPASYAGNYVTCTYEGMEGLVRLWRVTKDRRYLDCARRMADFHEAFDKLPEDHAHGSLSQHGALLMLYEDTGDAKYLKRVIARWDAAVKGGYVSLVGGVLEKFWVTGFNRDEGCAEADWLRLNLELWRHTGDTRYLDMAERELWSEYLANQWPSGGFGHRYISCDDQGPFGFGRLHQEALWCCSFHGPLGLYHLKSYLAVGGAEGIRLNFPADFRAPVKAGQTEWRVTSKSLPPRPGVPAACEVTVEGEPGKQTPLAVRIPEWASRVAVTREGRTVDARSEGGYLRLSRPVASGAALRIEYHGEPYLEDRRLKRVSLPKDLPAALDQVVLRHGPHVLVSTGSGEISEVTLQVGKDGVIRLPQADSPAALSPWSKLVNPGDPHAFVFRVRLEPAP